MDIRKANELLASMIKDIYEDHDGKLSKKTGLKAMNLVATSPEIQRLINIGNYPAFRKQIITDLNEQSAELKESNVVFADLLRDLYTSRTGRCKKSTAKKVMAFMENNSEFQHLANIGNYEKLETQISEDLNKKVA